MKKEHKREIVQLWWVANHYFDLAGKVISDNKLTTTDLQITVKKLAEKCQLISSIKGDVALLMQVNAHLGSCAVRLNTIDERIKSMRWKYYRNLQEKKNNPKDTHNEIRTSLDKIMHCMLRHNVAHEEYHPTKYPAHKIMQDTLMQLKVEELLDYMRCVKENVRADIEKHGVQI